MKLNFYFITFFLIIFFWYTSLVIRQKSESQDRGNKKTNHAKLSEKRTFLTRGSDMFVFEKFDVLCFLATSVLKFALLPNIDDLKDSSPLTTLWRRSSKFQLSAPLPTISTLMSYSKKAFKDTHRKNTEKYEHGCLCSWNVKTAICKRLLNLN